MKTEKFLCEKVKLDKIFMESEIFSEIGGNLKQGETGGYASLPLVEMDAPEWNQNHEVTFCIGMDFNLLDVTVDPLTATMLFYSPLDYALTQCRIQGGNPAVAPPFCLAIVSPPQTKK